MIYYKKDTDNIVTLTLDMTGRDTNVLNHEIVEAFIPVIRHLQEERDKKRLRGIIITSAKKSFLAGGDLEYLYKNYSPEEIFGFAETLQQFFRDLENPGVPVVAAINGTALGTGFELALACHYRVVINDASVMLGHPEVRLGLMPSSGGVIRLLWLLGLEKAFQVLTSGKRLRPQEALQAGIIDELAKDEADMLEKARQFLLSTQEGRRPWDIKGETIPFGTVKNPVIASKARMLGANLIKQSYHNFPAPHAILNTLVEGSKVDFDTACRIESRYFTQLIMRPETRNMIKAFWFDYNAILSGANRPKGFGKFRPKKVGIIGAGTMGSGIAFECLRRGLEVVIKDVSKAVADKGKEYVTQQLDSYENTGRTLPLSKNQYLERVKTTDTSEDFENCDLVIEAVFENKMVKTKVLQEAENHMDRYSIFGTNTVSIPITELGAAASRPENFIGLHFFSPVEQCPLVEIVKGKQTSDETVARAFDFVTAIKKIPILVKDNWGFYASRVKNTYILEGIQMLQEGYPAALIENMGIQSGMPKGPLAMADDLSLDLVLRYEDLAAQHYGTKYIQHPAVDVLKIMIEEEKRRGAFKMQGFYQYEAQQEPYLWEGLETLFKNTKVDFNTDELKERLLFAQVLEAVWCVQEGIVKSIPEANLGSIHGWGFPAFKGGVIQYINDYNLERFLLKCKAYESDHGPRFKVPKMLTTMATEQSVFV